MGTGDLVKPSAFEKIQESFERQLAEGGLSRSQIEGYKLTQLEEYLETVNNLIANPEGLGVAVAETGFGVVKVGVKVTALPLLLERKKLILDRISFLKGQEKITSLRELVNKKVSDDETRLKLLSEIDRLEVEAQKLREQTSRVEEALAVERVRREAEFTKLEVFKQRSQVWLTFLERESVATITGAILLVVITIVQIFAVFIQIPASDILNNAFLLILGYFFGQVSRGVSRSKE